MYCVFNATARLGADSGNSFGWPFETDYGYFCDQRDKGLFLLSNGILNVLAIVSAYLFVVLYLGPRLMLNKKPVEIKNLIRFYNGTMILINIYLIKRALTLVDNGRSFFNYTIWFVLRKKQSHISFLHVFHHSYVPIVAYTASRWIPVVPNAMFFPFINSAIHVVMYAYYLLATYPGMRPHLWWKRYLTGLQMAQFVSVLVYNIFGYFYFSRVCGRMQTPALVGSLISAIIFLALFNQFYKKAYRTTTSNGCEQANKTGSLSRTIANGQCSVQDRHSSLMAATHNQQHKTKLS